jgi:hypothetical protein
MRRFLDCVWRGVVAGLAIGAVCQTASAQAPAADAAAISTGRSIRDARYCEIIPVVREGIHLVAIVYNTLGLNDCPAAVWDGITEDEAKARFPRAVKVVLNGPRYFLMDAIMAGGATAAGETVDVAGLRMTERAKINLSLFELGSEPYRERTINRETRYVFKAGSPVFMLEAPDGSRYVMQAYAQIVDKALSYADLLTLGTRLKLPTGWRYATMVPDKDLIVGAQGKATVVQDNLQDTYQRLD